LGDLRVQRIGQDVEEVQALSRNFQKQSELIATAKREIAGGVDKAWWIGGAADRFRAAWNEEYAPALQKIEQALREAGKSIKAQSDDIKRAGG
jgi:uncharacterized protein YukE